VITVQSTVHTLWILMCNIHWCSADALIHYIILILISLFAFISVQSHHTSLLHSKLNPLCFTNHFHVWFLVSTGRPLRTHLDHFQINCAQFFYFRFLFLLMFCLVWCSTLSWITISALNIAHHVLSKDNEFRVGCSQRQQL